MLNLYLSLSKMKKKAKFFLDENRKTINRDFYIKVYCEDRNTLVGIPGLCDILGVVYAYKVLREALYNRKDKHVKKYRRGLTVSIYAK